VSNRQDIRDAAREARSAGGMKACDFDTFDVLLQESDRSARPVERYRMTIAARLYRTARTVTRNTSRLEAAGWMTKTIRKIHTASGRIVTLATRYTFRIPPEWSRVVTRETRTTPRPPASPSSTAAGSATPGVPPVRSPRPSDRPLSPLEMRVAAIAASARAP
jgi:hypothetical protein